MKVPDLKKVAITVGEVLNILDGIEPKIVTTEDLRNHKITLCFAAYMCRVGILDRIEDNNGYPQNTMHTLKIPTGIFSSRKETIESALNLTIGSIMKMASKDVATKKYVDDILNRRKLFYEYDLIISNEVKNTLKD